MDPTALFSLLPFLKPLVPYLALLPLAQAAAGQLAKLPALWGVTHDTVWSRALSAFAGFHIPWEPGSLSPAQAAALRAQASSSQPPPGVGVGR